MTTKPLHYLTAGLLGLLLAVFAVPSTALAEELREGREAYPERTLELLGVDGSAILYERTIDTTAMDLLGALGDGELGVTIDRAFEANLGQVLDELLQGNAVNVVSAVHLQGSWQRPLGIGWMTLEQVSLVRSIDTDGRLKTGIVGWYLAGKAPVTAVFLMDVDLNAVMEQAADRNERAASASAKSEPVKGIGMSLMLMAERFDLGDIRMLVRNMGAQAPFDRLVRDDALQLEAMTAVLDYASDKGIESVSLFGRTRLLGTIEANALFSAIAPDNAARTSDWTMLLGLRINEFRFSDAAPELKGSLVDELAFPSVALTITDNARKLQSASLDHAQALFYDPVFGEGTYSVDLEEGLNFGASMPISGVPEAIRTALGMSPEDRAIVEGNPGITFGLTTGFGFDRDNMYLRAELPPMSPANAPAWFVSGQLALEITGAPSLALVGEMTVDVASVDNPSDTDRLTFFLKGKIGRDGASVSAALVGGLVAERPWEGAFGLDWLTFKRAVLKFSINAAGNLGLGFAGDVEIGSKDISVAVFVAVNLATGVPTNFILQGASQEGVALSDLVALQAKMSAAAGRPAPRFPLSALPNVAVHGLRLKIALKSDEDLGVDAGFAVAGTLLVEKKPGVMERTFEIDLSVGLDGIRAYGYKSAFEMGPLALQQAVLDFELSMASQHLVIKGAATIHGQSRRVSVNLSARGLIEDFVGAYFDELQAVASALSNAKKKLDQKKAAAKKAIKKKRPTLKGRKRTRR